MTKDDTIILKGFCILCMLWQHLFNWPENVDICTNLIYVCGTPLTVILLRLTRDCCFIYCMLSGYGLYKQYLSGAGTSGIVRVSRLYIHYWIVLIPFYILACFVNPDTYLWGWDLGTVVYNLSAWNPTWNNVYWFIFPYAVAVFCSRRMFRMISVRPKTVLTVVTLIHCAMFIILYLYRDIDRCRLLFEPFLFIMVFFPFVIGAVIAKSDILDLVKSYLECRQPLLAVLLFVVVMVRLAINASFGVQALFSILFVPLFISLKRPAFIDGIFSKLGKRSTSMWFIHTWIAYCLLHDYTYSFRYPLAIFMMLVVESYLLAIVFDYIRDKILTCVNLSKQ